MSPVTHRCGMDSLRRSNIGQRIGHRVAGGREKIGQYSDTSTILFLRAGRKVEAIRIVALKPLGVEALLGLFIVSTIDASIFEVVIRAPNALASLAILSFKVCQ